MRDNLIKISATRVPNFEKKKEKQKPEQREEKRNSDEDKPDILILHQN